MELCFLGGKKPNSAKMVLINFCAHSLQIAINIVRAKIRGKNAFVCKSHKNGVNRVFWHAKFILECKTELNPKVFEKNAKNKIKYLLSLFFIFCDCL